MIRVRAIKTNLVFLISLLLVILSITNAHADPIHPPERTRIETETFTEREWWLLTWSDNDLACIVLVDHEGLPDRGEIFTHCGDTVLETWLNQPVCDGQDLSLCEGYYLHYVESREAVREIVVQIPLPIVSIRLVGCSPVKENDLCSSIPSLRISAKDPLRGEHIAHIYYKVQRKEKAIEGYSYDLPLFETEEKGSTLLVWADSSNGDSSATYEVLVRVFPAEGQNGWRVDVASALWQSQPYPENVLDWGAFPPLEDEPEWLSTPANASRLATNTPYYYLAGRLIDYGVAKASDCNSGGVRTSGYANQCGLEKAMDEVVSWQNQFDDAILSAAQKTGVPAVLLKSLIAQESQFWPGEFPPHPKEYGFGRMTEEGADALLRWNEEFYADFCLDFLSNYFCDQDYARLDTDLQALLRGALATTQDVSCSSCPLGFESEKLDTNIEFVADSLLANTFQVGHLIRLIAKKEPGNVASYKDLWRFTLANYNVGPGCLSEAISKTTDKNLQLNWSNVSEQLDGNCRNAISYVKNIREGR